MAITKINTPEIFDLGSTNTSVQLPSGNTASRPTSASAGEWRYNTDDNKVEYYDGSNWFQVDDEALPLPANFPGLNFNTNTYVGNGATQAIDAKFNEAAVFNGSSSRINLSSNPINGLTSVSFSFWLKPADISSFQYVLSFINSVNGWNGVGVRVSNTGKINVVRANNGAVTSSENSTTTLQLNVWQHIVVTVSQSSTVIYLDGSEDGTFSNTPFTTNNTGSFDIGMNEYTPGVTQAYTRGSIDQVRIYNTALTGTQVTNLYNNETTTTAGVLNFPTGAGCIAAYQLDGDASDVGGTYGGVPTDVGYTGLQFQPDLVWMKNRTGTNSHALVDSVRGRDKYIFSNLTLAEPASSTAGQDLVSFDSNGFTLGTPNNAGSTNTNGGSIVAWCWKAASSDSTNTDGTITSTVRANQEAGFSIVKFAGGNSSGTTVGHGLTQPIELLIVKNLNDGTDQWITWHKDIEQNSTSNNTFTLKGGSIVLLNSTSATIPSYSYDGQMGSIGGQNLIAYCFTSITGYQKIGSYTGNGSTSGPIVETGFEPAFVMIKNTDGGDSWDRWYMSDNKRLTDGYLYANESLAEQPYQAIKMLSNGFEVITNDTGVNQSSNTYIYLAIAADAQPAPVLADSFQPVIYTGNGGTQSIATDFQPDLVWIKQRTGSAANNLIFDSIRGAYKQIMPNTTSSTVDRTSVDKGVTSFNSNGFTVKDTSAGDYEINGPNGGTFSGDGSYVAWCWKAAGIPTINTEGSITSLTNANPAAGFSIVKYSGNSTAGATVGHGLSEIPQMIIVKRLSTPIDNWAVYNETIGNTYRLALDESAAAAGPRLEWNSTNPTNTVFTLGNHSAVNQTSDYIAYCFTSITGYQKVGSYTSQYPSTTSINVGFEPRFVMIKSYNQARNWVIHDSARGADEQLYANLANAEGNTGTDFQFTSTGFNVSGGGNDLDGGPSYSYIYLAIK